MISYLCIYILNMYLPVLIVYSGQSLNSQIINDNKAKIVFRSAKSR